MPVVKGRLNKRDQNRLDKNYTYLLENLDAKYVVDLLIERGIFTLRDSEIIRSQASTEDKNRTFLETLYNSGEAAYEVFRDILRRDYQFIVNQLDATEPDFTDNRSQGEKLRDELTDEQKAHRVSELDLMYFSKSFSTAIMSVATALTINKTEVEQIQLSNPYSGALNHNQCMLIKWRNKTGRAATLQVLVEAFIKAEEIGGELNWQIISQGVAKIRK
ncbi:uncharacterized protein LOC132559975 [Ylistrum balloti]|uniref:uncharacterized protein LOC132559975 n=1 Tax=Ylistrum balloti TaxID=509963 RepID=UPI002905C7EF|nr:uncharacterized protein LOC132559975 [Ylistrum balloti]